MQVAKYLQNYFHCPAGTSVLKYAEGGFYAPNDETPAHVALGIAELIDADASAAGEAAELADHATAAAELAVAAAVDANQMADAAAAAQLLADPPAVPVPASAVVEPVPEPAAAAETPAA